MGYKAIEIWLEWVVKLHSVSVLVKSAVLLSEEISKILGERNRKPSEDLHNQVNNHTFPFMLWGTSHLRIKINWLWIQWPVMPTIFQTRIAIKIKKALSVKVMEICSDLRHNQMAVSGLSERCWSRLNTTWVCTVPDIITIINPIWYKTKLLGPLFFSKNGMNFTRKYKYQKSSYVLFYSHLFRL